jgi:hypothetical protein
VHYIYIASRSQSDFYHRLSDALYAVVLYLGVPRTHPRKTTRPIRWVKEDSRTVPTMVDPVVVTSVTSSVSSRRSRPSIIDNVVVLVVVKV